MGGDKKVSELIKFLGFSFPKNPTTYVDIGNNSRSYEFLGMLELEKGFATPHTLGQRAELYKTMTDIQCVEFLTEYANRIWKGETEKPATYPYAELASYPVLMSLVTQEDIFRKLKGNELLTRTVITRKNEKTTMGVDPVIEDGVALISENEIVIEEDIDGLSAFSGKCLDPTYWSIQEWKVKTSNSQTIEFPVCFHNPPKDSKVEKFIPRVLLAEDDTIHVFSDTPFSRTSYLTKFPLVRRLK